MSKESFKTYWRRLMSTGSPEVRSQKLEIFRNSFINVATPLLAFVQPMEAQRYTVGEDTSALYSEWSVIEFDQTPSNLFHKLTVDSLEKLISKSLNYDIVVSSVSVQDFLLYAEFLPLSDRKRKVALKALLREIESDEVVDDDRAPTKQRTSASDIMKNTLGFIDLDVLCVSKALRGSDDDEEDYEVKIPKVRVYIKESDNIAEQSDDDTSDIDAGDDDSDGDDSITQKIKSMSYNFFQKFK